VNSVYQCFCDSAAQYPDKDFLHIPKQAASRYSDSSVDLSYRQAGAAIEQLKSLYQRAGFGGGHRIALLLQNRAEFLLHWLALNALGAGVVPINDEMSPEEQAYIINHSEASLLLYLPDLADTLTSLKPLLSDQMVYQDTGQLEQLRSPAAPASGEPPALHSECALLYTSGSTGKPKGCILTNEYFLLSGRRYVELGGLCAMQAGSERLITPLSRAHGQTAR
jgi:acyl-CoA synthetase (AMP-forming)/AMP-acid ligase II